MNIVEVKRLNDGPRNLVLLVYLKSDGESGELVDHVLIDPVDLGLGARRLRIKGVLYNFAGFDAVLSFGSGGVNQNWKWVLSERANHPVDFRPFGNVADDSGLDGTGKLLISTTGFMSVADQGSLLISLLK